MPRVFNRIRKQLAIDNKFFQYSRYAIGEILLVVIGILIALQVNNWNEKRLLRQSEKVVLASLNKEFDENLDKLKVAKVVADTIGVNSVELANIINNAETLKFKDRIPFLLFNCLFQSPKLSLSSGVLSDVVYSGKLNIIHNDELRTRLASFEAQQEGLRSHEEFIQSINTYLINKQLENGNFRKHLHLLDPNLHDLYDINPSKRSIDYTYLQEDSFENHLLVYHAALVAYEDITLEGLEEYLSKTNELIEKELKSLIQH